MILKENFEYSLMITQCEKSFTLLALFIEAP